MSESSSIDAALKRMREKAPQRAYSLEAEEALGVSGAMLSGSKRGPESIYWNACIFNDSGVQIWHGDLDLAKRSGELQELADRVGTVHLTPEQPFRFEGLKAGRSSPAADRIVTFTRSERSAP